MEHDQNSQENLLQQEAEASLEYQVRLKKVEAMRALGIDPWPQVKEVNATCKQLLENFDTILQTDIFSIAGRVMSIRLHGKTAFIHIQDMTGKIQAYLRQDVIGEQEFENFKNFIDLGDIIWLSGNLFKTKTGEITLRVSAYTLLSKSLQPLPEKFHGLADIEKIYRQRYLDLIVNSESRERFKKRSEIVRYMRDYFDDHGFIEVETPMLQSIPGGATAQPFVTHHRALDMDLYLRVAPELYLKRLVIGGFERVYEINRNFRNEGISTRHNPEFTMAEFYVAHHDYRFMMDFIENLFRFVIQKVNNVLVINYANITLDFSKPFKRISMYDAVLNYGALTPQDLEPSHIDKLLLKYNCKVELGASWGYKLVALFEELVEKELIQPTFVTDYPIEISPLTKRDPNNQRFVPRFELFIAGIEVANGYNELNDPFDQAARFKEQAIARATGISETHYYDADYVLALEHGLPPTVGAGIGIDRLTMILTNTQSIKDVILFPTLKKKKTD